MWKVLATDDAERELEALSNDQQAHFLRMSLLIEKHGLDHVRFPHVRRLEGPLWEIRLKG